MPTLFDGRASLDGPLPPQRSASCAGVVPLGGAVLPGGPGRTGGGAA
ncbi:hypothetical protein [Kitasatospora sp. NBC_00240]|nr:hypothetical protein [Kitasatospora sp. NBC_00240]